MSEYTMKQLADLAGLDISTVSRALRGDKRRVAPSTIARVKELADHVGYRPDPVAASLRNGSSRLVGVLVPALDDIVQGILVTAIDAAARERGYLSTVIATHDDLVTRADAVDQLLARRVDGLILCDSSIGHEVPTQLRSGDLTSTPVVYTMRRSDDGVSVTADDIAGGRLVADHLLGSGHRELAVVPGPPNARTAVDRVVGFVAAVQEEPGARVHFPPGGAGGFSVADGFEATAALFAAGARPTAVFCTNDHSAIGAARAIRDQGWELGRDVALVGYNDIPQAAYLETPLTSVRTDVSEMGRLALDRLLARIAKTDAPSVSLEPTLVVRESSGASLRRTDR